MNQLALKLDESLRHRQLKPGAQAHTLLMAFYRGERLTVLTAIQQYGVYALSQRCGELKRLGWPIKSELIETQTGKHVACYWVDFT